MQVSQRPYQLALLHEGVALYKENLKRNFNHRPANELPGVILAQLQILQDVQYQEIQEQLRQMVCASHCNKQRLAQAIQYMALLRIYISLS